MVGIVSTTLAREVPRVGRKKRSPQHRFQVRHRPWQIQPFMIAPVLPGDTMKNLLVQARIVTDTVTNPLVGWWIEHYFFYVPHRALAGSAQYQAMMLDPSATAGNTAAASTALYRYANSVDYVGQCLDAVVAEFFRDEGEAVNVAEIGGLPAAQLAMPSWLDSAMTKTEFEANRPPDVAVEGPDADTVIEASEIDIAMRQWQFLRDARMTDQTYEDFLRTYGVKIPDKEKEHLPELVRYLREWTYPSNTVDPATGAPSSALSWSIADRADKDRYFREPGFLFGVTVARPKVYLGNLKGAAVGMLDNVFAWLPAVLGDSDPYASLKLISLAGATPIHPATQAVDYIVDLKDLYLYGDQFVNHAMDLTASAVGIPATGMQKKYPTDADATNLYKVTATNGLVRQDGVVSLSILSRVVDTSAKT